jgi:hypothetical protein
MRFANSRLFSENCTVLLDQRPSAVSTAFTSAGASSHQTYQPMTASAAALQWEICIDSVRLSSAYVSFGWGLTVVRVCKHDVVQSLTVEVMGAAL